MNSRTGQPLQAKAAASEQGVFYRFLGLHTLLYGIFPFYIPVYMWTQGVTLAGISWFICLSGAGFILGLWTWDRLRTRISLVSMFALSLLLEVLLLLVVLVMEDGGLAMILGTGFAYGFYNCFYWTTQRALFYSLINVHNSGRKYGNLQIFVGALLQVGIVLGGYVLEMYSFFHVLAISALIAFSGLLLLVPSSPDYPQALSGQKSLVLSGVLRFTDGSRSRMMFLVDGAFLFAESFFWVVTLFLLVHESFLTLGIVVLSLAVVFGVVFYALKNVIDRISPTRLFHAAVVLYAASWLFRSLIHEPMPLEALYLMMVLITFLTAFFRLALNKRFYDIAQHTRGHAYLVLKSYYTQAGTVAVFALAAVLFMIGGDREMLLEYTYWILAASSFVYLAYGGRRTDPSSSQAPVYGLDSDFGVLGRAERDRIG
ncbi:MAG: MFS transporter [Gammaproteobacteria bacterium]|nr:MFS transporter [Gammaproteobacteria bacterium]MYJ52054.1 MFS transporter [Gammaproteobacteria bacterium]